jgi:hypothetical protein
MELPTEIRAVYGGLVLEMLWFGAETYEEEPFGEKARGCGENG